MLMRSLTLPLHRAVRQGGMVLLQGPRSAGKTTILQREFPAHTYVTLDSAADRARARSDPSAFLARLREPAIIDDLHRAPELVAAISLQPSRRLIFASSRRLRLPIETLHLYAPTLAERERRPPVSLAMLGHFVPAIAQHQAPYPHWPIHRHFLDHDLRDLVAVRDLDQFEAFRRAAQEQTARTLDQQALARTCGLSHRTVVRWLALLDSCFQTLRLPPADSTLQRRLVRRHKLHFLDSQNFESSAVSELFRNANHAGEDPGLYYWRDSNGFEIPLLVQTDAAPLLPVAFAPAPNPADWDRLRRWLHLTGTGAAALIAATPGNPKSGAVLRYGVHQL